MRIFIAGATGVIGRRILRLLSVSDHDIGAITRSQNKIDFLQNLGAEGFVCDIYNLSKLKTIVKKFQPDLIVDQLTDLPDDASNIGSFLERNNRIRKEGTKNLLLAAKAAGSPKFIIQSVAWKLSKNGDAAVKEMEKQVLDYGGTVLRYGRFFGPGTYYEQDKPEPPRIHIEKAAEQTISHFSVKDQIVNIVENE